MKIVVKARAGLETLIQSLTRGSKNNILEKMFNGSTVQLTAQVVHDVDIFFS